MKAVVTFKDFKSSIDMHKLAVANLVFIIGLGIALGILTLVAIILGGVTTVQCYKIWTHGSKEPQR